MTKRLRQHQYNPCVPFGGIIRRGSPFQLPVSIITVTDKDTVFQMKTVSFFFAYGRCYDKREEGYHFNE